MSVPSNWFTSKTLPHLFSFTIPKASDPALEAEILRFRTIQDPLNAIASQTRFNPTEIFYCHQQLLNALEHCASPTSSEEKQLFCRVNLALYMLHHNARGLPGEELARGYLNNTLHSLEELPGKTEEMWWYLACALHYQANLEHIYTSRLIDRVMICLENINSTTYKEALAYFIHQQYYPQLAEYPDYAPLRKLEQLLPSIPYRLDGHCAVLRHGFIRTSLKHQDFFNIQSSPLLKRISPPVPRELTLTISKEDSVLRNQSTLRITVDQYDLFQFSAHIGSPSPPMLHLDTPELTASKTTENFKSVLRKRHRTAGFCNGEGFLQITRLKKDFHAFRALIFDELIHFYESQNIHRFSNEQEKTRYREQFESNFTLEIILPQLETLDGIRKVLSGFNGVNAVFLFHDSLVEHPHGLPLRLLQSVRDSVRDCLEVLTQARAANQLSHFDKHTRWFAIANACVESLKQRPRHLVFQVGTPIKEGEPYSTHAFYVALKYLPENHQFQVVITNGGSAVRRFHALSPTQHKKDREEYSYAAFKPFDLNQSAEALAHYLYRGCPR